MGSGWAWALEDCGWDWRCDWRGGMEDWEREVKCTEEEGAVKVSM